MTEPMFLGVDPGKWFSGWALLGADGECAGAGLLRSRQKEDAVLAAREQAWQLKPVWSVARDFVVECPVIYPGLRKERVADILDLRLVCGVLIGSVLGEIRNTRVFTPTPAEWKGQVPKHIHHPRLRAKVPSAQQYVELVAPSLQQHVWDAVGLADWQYERSK